MAAPPLRGWPLVGNGAVLSDWSVRGNIRILSVIWCQRMERSGLRDCDDLQGWYIQLYATAVDPKRGNIGIIAPIAIGFIVGANILAGGEFDGASMNPAVCCGPAVVSWSWDSHWVYWLGPFLGAGIAARVYEIFFINPSTYEPLPEF
ncbi:hypothetical protein CRG98_013227 [Punica granatum]|uniref:Uncharacterized protein n=1 Tax=Punica granatum TaxID=22663 RepID=A0A2I0KD13_PUNGR|nr:hypothetical protein CRG98_013227 [Punica granatum]